MASNVGGAADQLVLLCDFRLVSLKTVMLGPDKPMNNFIYYSCREHLPLGIPDEITSSPHKLSAFGYGT
jgi:hypothetical protein